MAFDSACSRCPAPLRAFMLSSILLCGMLVIWNLHARLSPAHGVALIGAPVHPENNLHTASCWKPHDLAQTIDLPWQIQTAVQRQTPDLPGNIVAPPCAVPSVGLNMRGQRVHEHISYVLQITPPSTFRLPAFRIDPVAWDVDATPQRPSARGLIFFSLPPPLSA